jgi:hypothetical protein
MNNLKALVTLSLFSVSMLMAQQATTPPQADPNADVLTKFTELERLKIDDLQLKATNIVLQSNSFAAYYKDQQDKLSKEHDNDLSELNKDANDYLKAHNLEKKYLYNVKTGQFEFVPKPTPSATKSAVTPVSLAPKK